MEEGGLVGRLSGPLGGTDSPRALWQEWMFGKVGQSAGLWVHQLACALQDPVGGNLPEGV